MASNSIPIHFAPFACILHCQSLEEKNPNTTLSKWVNETKSKKKCCVEVCSKTQTNREKTVDLFCLHLHERRCENNDMNECVNLLTWDIIIIIVIVNNNYSGSMISLYQRRCCCTSTKPNQHHAVQQSDMNLHTERYTEHTLIVIVFWIQYRSSIIDSCISLRKFQQQINLFKYSFHNCDYLGDGAVAATAATATIASIFLCSYCHNFIL